MKHAELRPVDPAGTENRRWECVDCGKVSADISKLMLPDCYPLIRDSRTPSQRLIDILEEDNDH